MPLQKESFEALKQYIPDGSFDLVMPLILSHKVHLTVTRERQTKLGDYRKAYAGKNHRISVNGNLNRFSFLVTLLHELAHLLAYHDYGHRILPHGAEWKKTFSLLLVDFLKENIFPPDIKKELIHTLHNPGASTCSEESLQRVLRQYDKSKPGMVLVDEIEPGTMFRMVNGRVFERGEKIRKRIKCYEMPLKRPYLFSPLCEVLLIF